MFRDYWATPEQREKIIRKQNNDRIQIEMEKTKKYNPDVFKANKNKEEVKNKSLVKVEKQKWYEKVLVFIRNIFSKH